MSALREASGLWEASEVAPAAFGADVVGHYANMAHIELSRDKALIVVAPATADFMAKLARAQQ